MTIIQQSETQLHAEMTLVWYYLYVQRESMMQSTVGPEHFVASVVLGDIWRNCHEQVAGGGTIDMLEASRCNHDAYVAISDHVVVATREIVERTEAVVRDGAAVHRAICNATEWLELANAGESNAAELHSAFGEIAAEFQVGEDVVGEWHGTVSKRVAEQYLAPDVRAIPMPVLGSRLRGYKPKKFYLIGGITSTHKTTYALNSAFTAADAGFPVLYWTLEDDSEDVCERVIVSQTKLMTLDDFEVGRPERGKGDPSKMRDLIGTIEAGQKLPIMYLDKRLVLARIVAEISRRVHKYKIRMAIIDFMQLIPRHDSRMSDTDHQTLCSQTFADLAHRLNIPIIAVVQLTQEATKRSEDGDAPRTGDIRGGSAIGQAAYGVIMTHRPSSPITRQDGSTQLNLVIRKWKRGTRGTVPCWVDGAHDRIWRES